MRKFVSRESDRRCKFKDRDVARVKNLFLAGMPIAEIAKVVGCSRSTVYRFVAPLVIDKE